VTAALALFGTLLSAIVGIVLGVTAAVRGGAVDRFITALSGVLLSVLGGTAFTKSGAQAIEKGLRWLGVPRKRLQLGKGCVALAFLLLVLGLRLSLPSFAVYFNNEGARLHERQLRGAMESYQRAIRLDPEYAEPHYNLANAFEDALDFDNAIQEYLAAIRLRPELYPAINNLARLQILRKNDAATALTLLEDALALEPKDPEARSSIYKNRGWANLNLQLYSEAESDLRRALELKADGAAAHCLLAQVLDAEKNPRRDEGAASEAWTQCLAFGASQRKSVESSWLVAAQVRLRGVEGR
jgi:tetratricopeptide (TPR) repeat protein